MVIFIRYIRGQTLAIALLLLVSVTLVACGGGGSDTPIATQAPSVPAADQNPLAQRPQAATTASAKALAASATLPTNPDPFGGVAVEDAVEQLFNLVAEKNYPQYFPVHKVTQTYLQYSYRYYPETGLYVGVAVRPSNDNNTIVGGVYVMGGVFGDLPAYVGQLTSFITPKTVMHYKDVVYAIWGKDGVPFKVTKSGVEMAKNKTSFSLLYFCGLKDQDTYGRIGLLCQDSPSTIQRKLYIDPMTNEIHEDTGTPVRSDYVFASDFDPDAPQYATKARVSDGIFFTTDNTFARIDFQSNVTEQVSTVAEGSWETTRAVKYMRSFNN